MSVSILVAAVLIVIGLVGVVVPVLPGLLLVVEIAIDGVQTSTRYAGGVALRFARVKRYRPDKTADEADTIEAVRAIHRELTRST